MKLWTKEELIGRLREIREMGWIESGRHGNAGGVGNTIEDILGIEENNLPIPNASEWELKSQRLNRNGKANSLTTLLHVEPSPRACNIVPKLLLPNFGWPHKKAGNGYPDSEMSFRQTLRTNFSDRGFRYVINKLENKIQVEFDHTRVFPKHDEWLKTVKSRIGLGPLSPTPYWGMDEMFHKLGSKLLNSFYVGAISKKVGKKEFFQYVTILQLTKFSEDKFIKAMEAGDLLVDFDARTGHNHGTKFRIKAGKIVDLYEEIREF